MIIATSWEDVKAGARRRETSTDGGGGAVVNTPFIGSKHSVGMPHAQLNSMDSGRYSNSHYHVNDQFQIVLSGKGSLGRHALTPFSIHFSRAYTAYGPLVSLDNLTFFVLRAHPDPGGQHLPAKREALSRVANRKPWQVTANVDFSEIETSAAAAGAALRPIETVRDDEGLAAHALCMRAEARVSAPRVTGDGQYIVVFEGGIVHAGKVYRGPALVFVSSGEEDYVIHAGPNGLRALIANFPRRRFPAAHP